MPDGSMAIITEGKFEDLELFVPKFRFEEAGFRVDVLTPDGADREGEYGYPVTADGAIGSADPADYAALHLPGGVANPDTLRMAEDAVTFVQDFWEAGKPVFAICHGPWLLVEAGVLDGVEMTSWPSLRTDCENAGAAWRDEPVVVDGQLITSRNPGDLPAYCREAMTLLMRRVEPAPPA